MNGARGSPTIFYALSPAASEVPALTVMNGGSVVLHSRISPEVKHSPEVKRFDASKWLH